MNIVNKNWLIGCCFAVHIQISKGLSEGKLSYSKYHILVANPVNKMPSYI